MKLHDTAFGARVLDLIVGVWNWGSDHNHQWLAYNPALFYYFHIAAQSNAPAVIDAILSELPRAQTFVDVGAGSGVFAAELRRRGKLVTACEHSRIGRVFARAQGVDARPFDVAASPAAPIASAGADVAYSFEVAEHLPDALAQPLVDFTASLAPVVVWTAAHPGQTGIGHINEQPQGYWTERFDMTGYAHATDGSERLSEAFRAAPGAWFADNVMLFRSV